MCVEFGFRAFCEDFRSALMFNFFDRFLVCEF